MMGIMAAEGGLREKREHCNIFDTRDPSSAPMLFWTEADVWEYIRTRNLPYSKIYDMGEKRTGCIFCGFGAHLEKGETRFQRLARTHPKLWSYCINDLKMGAVLDAVGVAYKPDLLTANMEFSGAGKQGLPDSAATEGYTSGDKE